MIDGTITAEDAEERGDVYLSPLRSSASSAVSFLANPTQP